MRASLAAAVVVPALLACAGAREHVRTLPPLGDESEVLLYLEPLPRDAERLAFALASVSLLDESGGRTPLELVRSEVAARDAARQTLLARGRIPAGNYAAVELKVAKATLVTEGRPADLLVSEEPLRVEARFFAAAGRAVVRWLVLKEGGYTARSVEFAPAFSTVVPSSPVSALVGYASSTTMNHLTLFDKRARQVVGVVPTGRAPRGLAVDPRLERAYVAVTGDDEVQAIDIAAGAVAATARLAPGDEPVDVAITPDGRLLVAVNRGSRTASFIDTRDLVEIGRVPTGDAPASVLVDRAGRRAYVFNSGTNSLTVLDLANRSVAATVALEAEPLRGALNRSGSRLYVLHENALFMSVLSLPDLAVVNKVFVGLGATAVLVDPRTDLTYVARRRSPTLQIYDPLSFTPLDSVELPGPPEAMVIDDLANVIVAGVAEREAVAFVDLASRRTLSLIDVGGAVSEVAVVGERR